MSKQAKWIMGIIAGFLLVLVLFADLWTKSATWYKGDRTKNPDLYMMSFTSMNGKDSHTLHVAKGQKLELQYEIEGGNVNISIAKKGENPFYDEKHVSNAKIAFTTLEEGDYVVTVRAGRAKGKINVKILDESDN